MNKFCPNCQRQSASDATQCACGFNFAEGRAPGNNPWLDPQSSWTPAKPGMSKQAVLRWVLSILFVVMGVLWVVYDPNLVLRGTPISFGYLFIVVGGVGILGCIFGINVFKGGPLDMRNDS